MQTKLYHLGVKKEDLMGSTTAIIPGDPGRVSKIAAHLPNARHIATKREFVTYIGELNGKPVTVTSTGIGGASTAICIEELALLGIKNFIRVGTTGTIQPYVELGDLIITQGAVRLDGVSDHYMPVEYPAIVDFTMTGNLVQAAKASGWPFHVGTSVTSSSFYPGQERYDTYSTQILGRWQGSLKEWQRLGALNYEMESASVFAICSAMGLKASCVLAVIAHRLRSEKVDEGIVEESERRAIHLAIEGARAI